MYDRAKDLHQRMDAADALMSVGQGDHAPVRELNRLYEAGLTLTEFNEMLVQGSCVMLRMDNTTVHTHSHINCVVAVPGPRCIIQRYKNMRHIDSSYIAAGQGDLGRGINAKTQREAGYATATQSKLCTCPCQS